MERESFEIKSYKWKEFAMLYCPDVEPDSATRCMRRWIAKNEDLQGALIAQGWEKGLRVLTPAQVEVFLHYLGTPSRIRG